ncbi:MAG: tRNA-intron lyase [Candidatus Thorarchaeota archaeon]|nr:tRNA-intron lyase [Candidatus Thorarchaeota archaeon]
MTGEDDKFPEMEPSKGIEEIDLEEDVIEEPVDAVFDGRKGYVGSSDADKISQQGFYGNRTDDNRLELEPVELLHLIERKRLVVKKPDGESIGPEFIVSELLDDDQDLWTKYLVFRDLRSRGYAVRQGFGSGIGFRVYSRGDKPGNASASQLVYVLKEGVPISLSDLDMVTQTAAGSRKKLVFALVDQNGEVNFYRVAQANLRTLGSDDNGER